MAAESMPVSALPTPTRSAPASMNSATSSGSKTPPIPITVGPCPTASRTRLTERKASGRMPTPDKPPTRLLRMGIPARFTVAGPTVLDTVIPAAPASIEDLAVCARSRTTAESFTKTGSPVAWITALVISTTNSRFCPISTPYPSACGQDIFNSKPSATERRAIAVSTNCFVLPPKMETKRNLSPGTWICSSSARNFSAPGFDSPTALM